MLFELDWPAASVAEQVSVIGEPSAVSTSGPHPLEEAIALSGSVTDQVTVVSASFHPLAFGTGEIVASIVGGTACEPATPACVAECGATATTTSVGIGVGVLPGVEPIEGTADGAAEGLDSGAGVVLGAGVPLGSGTSVAVAPGVCGVGAGGAPSSLWSSPRRG
jgi:hypothetical protein